MRLSIVMSGAHSRFVIRYELVDRIPTTPVIGFTPDRLVLIRLNQPTLRTTVPKILMLRRVIIVTQVPRKAPGSRLYAIRIKRVTQYGIYSGRSSWLVAQLVDLRLLQLSEDFPASSRAIVSIACRHFSDSVAVLAPRNTRHHDEGCSC